MPIPLSLIPGLFKYYTKVPKAEETRIKDMTPIDVIIECLDEKSKNRLLSRIFLLLAGTGTGKSTALPVYLFEHISRSILLT